MHLAKCDGQINGKPKLQIAREALAKLLQDLPADMVLGSIYYRHRARVSCTDIEGVVQLTAGTGPTICAAVVWISQSMRTNVLNRLLNTESENFSLLSF